MYTYLLFNIAVIIFPFLLSFDKKVAFWRKWKFLAISILLTDLIFVTWDSIVTGLGHWSFNEDHLTGLWVFGIPVEELMFFFTVPYACIFTYEVIKHYLKDWEVPFNIWTNITISAILFFTAFIFMDQGYTFIVLIYTAMIIILLSTGKRPLLSRRRFWIYTAITIFLFTIFNMILTWIPVVEYGPEEIWGGDGLWNGRFYTIPLEDFFYNFSMLSTYLLTYNLARRLLGKGRRYNEE